MPSTFSLLPAGLHGTAVAISGRRQQVLDGAVASLAAEGIQAVGLQACILFPAYMIMPAKLLACNLAVVYGRFSCISGNVTG
jgi:hypothetical protein